MAYTLEQRRYFAHELARSGGNVAAAAKHLRDEYETLRNVGESTLRRWLKEPEAGELIAVESAIIAKAAADASAEAARAQVRSELMGSEVNRLARDELILDDLRSLVAGKLDEASRGEGGIPVSQIANLYERMTRIHDSRRVRVLPAVADTRDATLLLKIIAEEALTLFGAKAREYMERVRDRYAKELELTDAATVAT